MQNAKSRGSWLVRNSAGRFGFVATDNLDLNMDEVKNVATTTLKVSGRKPNTVDVRNATGNYRSHENDDDDDDDNDDSTFTDYEEENEDEPNDDIYDTAG